LNRKIAISGMIITAVTIAIGAFGAHGLRNLVDTDALNTFEVGVRYQMYHALAIVLLGFVSSPNRLKRIVFTFFVLGILFFSGSIYLLSLNAVLPFDAAKIGFITPMGGLMFILGWLRWAYGLFR
jgi:uncharacterized membrane protein YgdD (TMEM256/DUF423 family)